MGRDIIKETLQGWQEETPDIIKQAAREALKCLPKRNKGSRKVLITLAACVCAAVILFVTPVGSYALAAVKNVFGLFAQQRYVNEAQKDVMTELEENAQRPVQQTVLSEGDDQALSVNIDGIFYDGEQLAVSYVIQGKRSFDIIYEPTEAELAQMEPVGEHGIEPANAPEEDIAAVNEKIERGQPAGWRSYDIFINDGTYTNDGLNVPAETDDYFWNGEEKVGVRFFELTEELKKRDKLTIDIGFTVYESCYYFNGSKAYYSSKKCESLTIEVSADKKQAIKAQGSAEFKDYSAEAGMSISPVFISTKVVLTPVGDEQEQMTWLSHYRSESDLESVPLGYDVLDGEGNVIVKNADTSLRISGIQVEINLRFAAAGDLPGQLILRPTFANGVTKKEDIIINLP